MCRAIYKCVKAFTDQRLTHNGTAVVVVNVTRRNPPVDCPGMEYGAIPVGRWVWRGICKVACGWFRYRVTMMLVIRCLYCLSFWYPVKVRVCKYRDKFITTTDRVSTCLAIGQVSWDEGIVPRLVLRANEFGKCHAE